MPTITRTTQEVALTTLTNTRRTTRGKSHPVTLHIPLDMVQPLDKLAVDTYRSRTAVILQAIVEYMKRQEADRNDR